MSALRPSASSHDRRWYALQSRPKQETRAEANLRTWGVETLLPLIRRRSTNAMHVEALFPGYLFARFDAPTMIQKVRYTRGIARIVGVNHEASAIDPDVIALIRDRIAIDGYVRLVPDLKIGDRVRVTAGPLRDFVGVFESSTTSAQRITLLLAAMHTPIRVLVDGTMVERARTA